MSQRGDRVAIFVVAALVRGLVGWIFFASVDMTNAMLFTAQLYDGAAFSSILVPYFPGVYQLLIWTSGVLVRDTALPLAFAYKLFPLVFDAALAVIVYDFLAAERRRARIAGWLYVFAPVPIIICSIHVQWDAIAFSLLLCAFLLLTRPTTAAAAMAGVAFVLSALVKPLAIPFVPFLLPLPRRRVVAFCAGMFVCGAGYLAALYTAGDPLTWTSIAGVLYYAKWGAQIFGLPVITGGHVNRLLILLPLLLLAPLYWRGRLTRIQASTLILAFILTGALSPQYLAWIVPFLLVWGKRHYAALYSLAAGLFLMIYYHHPGPRELNYESMGALALLRGLDSWSVSATFLREKLILLTFLGSLLIPLSALAFFTLELIKAMRRTTIVTDAQPPLTTRQMLAPIAVGCAVVAIAFAFTYTAPAPTSARFHEAVEAKTAEYAMYRYHGPGLITPSAPSWVIPAYTRPGEQKPRVIDAASIGYCYVILWSIAAVRLK